MVNNISKVMMAAEAMAGADAEEDIHTRFWVAAIIGTISSWSWI